MDKEKLYRELKKENIGFVGRTSEEEEFDKILFNIALELDRYQDMTQEVLNYIVRHEEVNEVKEIYNIIKKWAC